MTDLSPDIAAIVDRCHGDLVHDVIEMLADEDRIRPPHVSAPDMHVALIEALVRVTADLVLSVPEITPAAARYVAEYVGQRLADEVAKPRGAGTPMRIN